MLLNPDFKLPKDFLIIFNHIPKTGGTSVINFFTELLGEEKCFRHKERDTKTHKLSRGIEQLTEEEKANLSFVAGHFKIGMEKHFGRQPLQIGVIRDPIERFISDYYYNRRSGRPEFKKVANELNINEYLQHKLTSGSNLLKNNQITTLTTKKDVVNAVKVIENKYLLCCEIKQLDRFFEVMSMVFGVEYSAPIRANVTPDDYKSQQLSDESKDIIKLSNQTDLDFCRYIEESFESVYAQMKQKSLENV